MAISYTTATATSGSGTANGGSITIPAGAPVGARCYLVVAINTANVIGTPAGWAHAGSSPLSPGSTLTLAVFTRTLTAGQPGSSVTIDTGGNARWSAGMICLAGASAQNAAATPSSDNSADTAIAYPGITPGADDSMLVAIGGLQVPASPTGHAPPATWTEAFEVFTSIAGDPQIGAFCSVKQLSGQSGVPQSGVNATGAADVRDGVFLFAVTPTAANVAPTADAGPDQADVEPFATVTLTGGGGDTDGTIVSHAWTQTGGSPAVTLSGTGTDPRTFEAPATMDGVTLTFQLVTTDDDAATSSPDTVDITVLPHNMWRVDDDGIGRSPIRLHRIT